jgi:hypothetical protein
MESLRIKFEAGTCYIPMCKDGDDDDDDDEYYFVLCTCSLQNYIQIFCISCVKHRQWMILS